MSSSAENLKTVRDSVNSVLEVKKSQFIAHLVPISAFESTLTCLRQEHRKARHFVWAIRHLNPLGQIVENCTDDGEPRNTSGKPTLNALQAHELIDVALITVRYFGGTKLGTGGLVRAYNEAAQDAILSAELIPLSHLYSRTFSIDYQQSHHADYLLQQAQLKILNKTFAADHIELTLQGEKTEIERIIVQLGLPESLPEEKI